MSDPKKVLIVDDEADAIDITDAMLSRFGNITTISASDGDSGLEKAKSEKPDLIILDVEMPGKSGFDVFVELKKDEATAGIPIVMLTGVKEKVGIPFSADAMKDFLGYEPEAYIEKPVQLGDLQKTVSSILGL